MMLRPNFALMEAENARRRVLGQEGQPALHPLAEFYEDWAHARKLKDVASDGTLTISLTCDDYRC